MEFDTVIAPAAPAPAPAPAPAAPASAPAAPAPAPADDTPEQPGPGIAGLMEQLDKAVAADGKPKPEVPSATSKPVDPKPAAAADAPKPPEGEPDWSKAPPKWHKIYEGHKAKTADMIRSLESKIKALETKPFEQAGDAKKLETLEKQLEEIRGESTNYKKELARLDYTKSDDYKTQYVDKAQQLWQNGVALVEKLSVADAEGNQRPGVKGDFERLRRMDEADREEAATTMFGAKARSVLKYLDALDQVRADADAAVQRHGETHERTAVEREADAKKQKDLYDGHYKTSLEALKANPNYGKWFSESADDPEASEMLRAGFDKIEKITAQLDKLPPDEQAAYSAMFRAQAAAMPRMVLEVNRLNAMNAALVEELEKYRGTDPGAKGSTGVQPPSDNKPKGIQDMAAAFDVKE